MKIKKEEFDNYVKDYDMTNWMIDLKYYHTYRVVEYCTKIARSLNLDEHDTFLAETIGLLHDIARFKQAKEFNTFKDNISFDHGDMGCEILLKDNFINKFVEKEEDKDLVLKAIRLHNKKYIEEDLTDLERIFCNIIRDADKLDIMDKQGIEIKDDSTSFNEEALEEVRNKKLVTYQFVDNDATNILKTLAYIFDLNYKESFKELKELGILERKFSCLKEHLDKEKVEEVENIINTFIEKRMNCYE